MDVASLQFLGFALVVAGVYNLFRPLVWRQAILLSANVVFLAAISLNWKAYVPLALFLALGYAGIRLMQSWKSNGCFLPLIMGVVLIFIYLKQYKFLPAIEFPAVLLYHGGLSYIFFRVVHMIVDARDGALSDRVGSGCIFELHSQLHDADCGSHPAVSRFRSLTTQSCAASR